MEKIFDQEHGKRKMMNANQKNVLYMPAVSKHPQKVFAHSFFTLGQCLTTDNRVSARL